jgi:hypothetical protein
MASKADLRGSFGSLVDTLSRRFDPLLPKDSVETWLGLMGRSASIARSRRWQQLPDKRGDYVDVVADLDSAVRELVNADPEDAASIDGALRKSDSAFDGLKATLEK